jgi:hypothetical protein
MHLLNRETESTALTKEKKRGGIANSLMVYTHVILACVKKGIMQYTEYSSNNNKKKKNETYRTKGIHGYMYLKTEIYIVV